RDRILSGNATTAPLVSGSCVRFAHYPCAARGGSRGVIRACGRWIGPSGGDRRRRGGRSTSWAGWGNARVDGGGAGCRIIARGGSRVVGVRTSRSVWSRRAIVSRVGARRIAAIGRVHCGIGAVGEVLVRRRRRNGMPERIEDRRPTIRRGYDLGFHYE